MRRLSSQRGPGGDRPRTVLGLSFFYHDSAACLVRDDEIVAAVEEERLTRLKNDRRFPYLAANYCLEEAGIHQDELDAVVYYENPALTAERLLHTLVALDEEPAARTFAEAIPSWAAHKLRIPELIGEMLVYDGLILQEEHHRSHAAAAFYPSPFDEAAILTVDGVGEWATATIGRGSGSQIELLSEMHFPHSVGLLYSAFTQFTGFKVNSGEYKMMGLAPYGRPTYVDAIREHIVDVKDDGSIELNLECFKFLEGRTMTGPRFAEVFAGPARKPDMRITQRERDIARSIQEVTEDIILRMAAHAQKETGASKLCLAGGVALNCVANGRLLREGPFEDLWIQPAAGDAGSALGAALDVVHNWFDRPRAPRRGRSAQGGSKWGPGFGDDEIRAFLETHGYPYREVEPQDRAGAVADLLASEKVVGHFSGRSELGPRALGSRSILADARSAEMQVTLNLKIKYRESFRPFAPSVLEEDAGSYFELDRPSPYMLLVAPVAEARRLPTGNVEGEDLLAIVKEPRSDVPAITHVDHSARVQTVRRDQDEAYYELLLAFKERTGCSVLVNTSFNVRGEPIVCSPFDAYRCFMRTEMDHLVLGRFILDKPAQPPWPEERGHIEQEDDELAEAADPAQSGLRHLAQQLQRVYEERFVPVAEELRQTGGSAVQGAFTKGPTTWKPHARSGAAREIFEVPLAGRLADPAAAARSITSAWAPGRATEALRPVVEELLAAAAKARPDEPLREQVSESVYVLF